MAAFNTRFSVASLLRLDEQLLSRLVRKTGHHVRPLTYSIAARSYSQKRQRSSSQSQSGLVNPSESLCTLHKLQVRHFNMGQLFGMITQTPWQRFDPKVQQLIKMEDVAGMTEAKTEIMEFVDFLTVSNTYY